MTALDVARADRAALAAVLDSLLPEAGFAGLLHEVLDATSSVVAAARAHERERQEAVIDGIKACWGVDMRQNQQRGETLTHVRALADRWAACPGDEPIHTHVRGLGADLLAALAQPAETQDGAAS